MERLILTMSALAIFAQLELVSICVAARFTVSGHHVAENAFVDSHFEKTSTNTSISTWAYLDFLKSVCLHVFEIQEVALQQPDASFYRASASTTSTDNVLSPRFDGEELAITSLHLGAKAIAGIVGGSVAVIVLGIVLYLLSRDSRRRRQAMAENGPSASREECFDDVVRRKQTAVMPNNPADPTTQPSFVAKTGDRAALQLEGRAGRVRLDYSVATQRGPIQAGVPPKGRPAVTKTLYARNSEL